LSGGGGRGEILWILLIVVSGVLTFFLVSATFCIYAMRKLDPESWPPWLYVLVIVPWSLFLTYLWYFRFTFEYAVFASVGTILGLCLVFLLLAGAIAVLQELFKRKPRS
jgi:hypothetical protein